MKSIINSVIKTVRTLSLVFLSTVLCISCSSSQDDSDAIDYSSLEELSAELVLTIGESEDYIPDNISDLQVTHDGTMLIHDGGHSTLEQFDSDGNHLGTVAQEGRGPGELSNIFNLHLLNGDTVIARNRTGRKDYFAPAEGRDFTHINTIQSEQTSRSLGIVDPVTEDKFYAVKKNEPAQRAELKNPKTTHKEAFVVVDENEKIVNDSIHVLKRRGSFSKELKAGGFIRNDYPFQIHELVVPLNGGNYMIARPDSSAFFVYNEDHNLQQRIPVRVKERPITEEDLDFKLDHLPDEATSEINKMRPDTHPPYYKVFASDSYYWLQTRATKEGKEIVVLDHGGEPVGKFVLPEHESFMYYENIAHVEDGRIYTINSSEQGDEVRIYNIDLNE